MPEGDTLYKLARTIGELLARDPLLRLRLAGRERAEELTVPEGEPVSVRSLGKHLLIELGAGAAAAPEQPPSPRAVLHLHLGMHGSWRAYPLGSDRPGEAGLPLVEEPEEAAGRHARPAKAGELSTSLARASALLFGRKQVLACFSPSTCELLDGRWLPQHPVLSRLGPDLLGPSPDQEEILRRARSSGPRSLEDLLLDQQVAAGIGNVYKSEVLFVERQPPQLEAHRLSDDRLLSLYQRARTLLQANLGPGERRTTPPGTPTSHWVYRRAGRPCLRCGRRLASHTHGEGARTTYWCPNCQQG